MASTRGKGSRSGRGGARGRAKAGAKKGAASARAKKPARAAKAARKPTRAAKPAAAKRAAKPAASQRAAGGAEVAKLKARHDREKSALEKRLTESVREIGQLRHHEARATQLERQLKERDDTIAQLRRELTDLRSRPTAPLDEDPEVQPSLALGERAPRDLDDFDDEIALDDEDELV